MSAISAIAWVDQQKELITTKYKELNITEDELMLLAYEAALDTIHIITITDSSFCKVFDRIFISLLQVHISTNKFNKQETIMISPSEPNANLFKVIFMRMKTGPNQTAKNAFKRIGYLFWGALLFLGIFNFIATIAKTPPPQTSLTRSQVLKAWEKSLTNRPPQPAPK